MSRKDIYILSLVCVIVVLVFMLWFKEDLKKDSATTVSTPVSTISKPVSPTVLTGAKDEAPVAPKSAEISEVDQRLKALGFKPSSQVHKMSSRPIDAAANANTK